MANPNRHELIALAERWEQTQAPDRELDAATAVALRIGVRSNLPDDHEYLSRIRKDDECAPGTYWFHCRSGKSLRTAPEYSKSLDAANSLIPNDYLRAYNDIGADGLPLFTLFGPDMPSHHGIARTMEICMIVAALRAHAEMVP